MFIYDIKNSLVCTRISYSLTYNKIFISLDYSMTEGVLVTDRLVTASCPRCGVVHALPRLLNEQRRRTGRPIHCPNGHQWVHTDTLEDHLAELLGSPPGAKQVKALQGQLVQERHRSEQLEAKVTAMSQRAGQKRHDPPEPK